MRPYRPALRYLGGKWLLAPWVIKHFPPHRIYVEPYGGAASVLLRKPKSYAEIYNELDGDVVNLFQVLRDSDLSERLVRAVRLTPFARPEFEAAYERASDQVERARRLVVRSYMGHGPSASNIDRTTGFRASATRNGCTPAQDWANFPPALAAIARRIHDDGVTVESRPALEVIRRFDCVDALIYADPPYVHSTRSPKTYKGGLYSAYGVEMTNEEHAELLATLRDCASMVVLSGYPSPLYDEILPDWKRVERGAMADGAQPRREVLWINPAAVRASGMLNFDGDEASAARKAGGDA